MASNSNDWIEEDFVSEVFPLMNLVNPTLRLLRRFQMKSWKRRGK